MTCLFSLSPSAATVVQLKYEIACQDLLLLCSASPNGFLIRVMVEDLTQFIHPLNLSYINTFSLC